MNNKLYIISTPIGNLEDITLRAIRILKEVDMVFSEDTRVSLKLLNHFHIKKPIRSFHQHTDQKQFDYLLDLLKEGKNIAYITDSGTPTISDPGAKIVKYVYENLPEVQIVPIPGPAALIAAFSISGIESNEFTFLGFPPNKKGRQTFFKNLKNIKVRPIIFYESCYRVQKALEGLKENFGGEYEIVVASELTKYYEKIFRGSIDNAIKFFVGDKLKGEFVFVVK